MSVGLLGGGGWCLGVERAVCGGADGWGVGWTTVTVVSMPLDGVDGEDVVSSISDVEVRLVGGGEESSWRGMFRAQAATFMATPWPYRTVAAALYAPFARVAHYPGATASNFFPAAAIYVVLASTLAALAWLVTGLGVFALFVAGIWRGAVAFARTMAFPGHVSTVARQIENDVARQHARAERACLEAVYMLLPGRTPPGGLPEAAQRARRAIDARLGDTCATLALQEAQGTLRPAAAQYRLALRALLDATEQVLALSTSEETEKRGRVFDAFSASVGAVQALESSLATSTEAAGSRLSMPTAAAVDKRMAAPRSHWAVALTSSIWQTYKTNQAAQTPLDTVLNVDFFRMDLVRRHGAEILQLTGSDGTTFEAIFIPATVGDTGKGVLFCNPNGGLYEYVSHWAGYYQSRGLAVLLFNYRGYGRSEGTPEPSVLKRDGIVAFYALQSRLLASRPTCSIMVHGESLGGMVAAHVACECAGDVDLLVVDRSFKSLGAAGRYLLAWWAEAGMDWTTWWKTDAVPDFVRSSCPKLMTCDPEDKMIADLASLKVGVASHVIEEAIRQGHAWARKEIPGIPLWKQDGKSAVNTLALKQVTAAVKALFTKIRSTIEFPGSDPGMNIKKISDTVSLLGQTHNRCHKSFLAAATNGPEELLAWAQCYLVFGNASLLPESAMCHSLEEVVLALCNCVQSGAVGEATAELQTVAAALAELSQRFKERHEGNGPRRVLMSAEERRQGAASGSGLLLPLTCGHNNAMHDDELDRLEMVLQDFGW